MTIEEYPFQTTIEIAFRDVDAMGHVNHAVYFTYMETARITYLTGLLDVTDLRDLPLIVAKATCTYESPAFYGEQLRLGTGVSRFGTTSFDLLYRIETTTGRLVTLGKTVQVMYDYEAERPFPVPERFKERVHARQRSWRPDADDEL